MAMLQMVLRADKDWAKKMVDSSEFEEWIKSGEGKKQLSSVHGIC